MSLIREHVALERFNSFGLPATAARFVAIESVAEARALIAARALGERVLVLGGGSNTIFAGDFDGLVLQVRIAGRRLLAEDAEAWLIEAGAGESWHEFVCWTLAGGWPGLENLALIPGTVGAAPIQNIGAYGLEMGELFHSLDAIELATGDLRVFERSDCAFAYRDSVFKHAAAARYLISAVRFRLPRAWRARCGYAELARELETRGLSAATPSQIAEAVIAIRRRKLPDPAQLGNAGSFFKNPLVDAATHARLLALHPGLPAHRQADGSFKLAAGWLIEQAGWKGRDLGPVGAYEKQALVLVNRGGARGADVRRIAAAIHTDVQLRFGVELEPEPVFVGG